MKQLTLAALGLVLSACVGGFDSADLATRQSGLSQVATFGELKMYLYAPAQLPATNVPVVVAMHGCSQNANAYQSAGWNRLADERGFLVVYPEVNSNGSCFAWFDSNHNRRDRGQALAIKQMVDWVKGRYAVGEVFVTGLSAGGAMTAVMLATYPDVFSAGAVMAGIPYRCADSQLDSFSCMFSGKSHSAQQWGDLVRSAAPATGRFPRLAVFQGTADHTVEKVNGDALIAQWTNLHGITAAPLQETRGSATRSVYLDASGASAVEYWTISGMGHGTAVDPRNGCGSAGAFMLDVGLCSTRESARLFGLLDAPSGSDGGLPPVDGGVTSGDAGVGASDGGVASGDAGVGASDGGDASAGSCSEFRASNYEHTRVGRAALCQPVNGHTCALGSGDDLGLYNVFTQSWVRQVRSGHFESGRCP